MPGTVQGTKERELKDPEEVPESSAKKAQGVIRPRGRCCVENEENRGQNMPAGV